MNILKIKVVLPVYNFANALKMILIMKKYPDNCDSFALQQKGI